MKTHTLFAAALATSALLAMVPAQAGIVTYAATLTGLAESPPVVTPGTGSATVIIDDQASTMRVLASFSGLIGNSTVAHIHCCTAVPLAGNVGVATVTPTFTGFPAGVTAGSYDMTYDMTAAAGSWNNAFVTSNGGTTASAFNTLLAGLNSGRAYFNLHSSFQPSGEIRGLLQAVPEPGTMALVGAAVAAAVAASRKQRAV